MSKHSAGKWRKLITDPPRGQILVYILSYKYIWIQLGLCNSDLYLNLIESATKLNLSLSKLTKRRVYSQLRTKECQAWPSTS
jgi:hypothetical protein